MNSPYTHPSMPGTPAMVLSAALEDAEGHALVAAIHKRKQDKMAAMLDSTTRVQGELL
jgi:uncharacterized protein (DUF849 family)